MKQTRAKHILIVDDSEDSQSLLKHLLEARGYTTECTSNGEEALTLLKSSARLPNAILLDLRMPVMDGWTFRKIQKADGRLKQIPVVVMSAEHDLDEIQHEAGTEVVQKPLNMFSILEVVKRSTENYF